MKRLIESILGLEKGFLNRDGEFSLQFNPRWPFQESVGAVTWNLILAAIAVALVLYVYRREGRGRTARIVLGSLRLCLLGFIIAMLNRPVLNLGQSRTEPSVLAVMMDDSVSMRVKDGGETPDGAGRTRLQAVLDLLGGEDHKLVKDLAKSHQVKLFKFNKDASPIGTVVDAEGRVLAEDGTPTTQPLRVIDMLHKVQPDGQSTQ